MKAEMKICAICGRQTPPVFGGVDPSSDMFLCQRCMEKEYAKGSDPNEDAVRDLRRECVFTITGTTEFPTRDTRMGEFRDEWDELTKAIKGWNASCDRWDIYGNFEISVLDEGLWDFYGAIMRHGVTISDVQCNWRYAPKARREDIIRLANTAVEYRSKPLSGGRTMFDRAWNAI